MRERIQTALIGGLLIALLASCSREEKQTVHTASSPEAIKARALAFLDGFLSKGESKEDLLRRLGRPQMESGTNDALRLDYFFRDDFEKAIEAGVFGVTIFLESEKVTGWLPIYGDQPTQPPSDSGVNSARFESIELSFPNNKIGLCVVSDLERPGSIFYDSVAFPKLGYINRVAELSVEIKQASLIDPSVCELQLLDADRDKFRQFTADHVGKRVALMIGAEVLAAPFMQTPITDGSVRLKLNSQTMSNLTRSLTGR